MEHMFIYETTNLVNGKMYIGYCNNPKNHKYYLGSGKRLKQAIKKYGRHNFKRKILEYHNNHNELINAEKRIIKERNAVKDNNYYNILEGGNASPTTGKQHSEETRRKIGLKSVNRNWGRHTPVNGSNNPMAKRVLVNDVEYKCLKDYYDLNRHIPYSTLKCIARNKRDNNKYNLRIRYVI